MTSAEEIFSVSDGRRTLPKATDVIPKNWLALDIGPQTIKSFSDILDGAKTIIWNGSMGVYEMKPFQTGTTEIAQSIANSQATSIIGGGDTVAPVLDAKIEGITHICSGGGAMLSLLMGKSLPAIKAIRQSYSSP